MAWDLDVDAFLDDYLKDVDAGPPDPFGTYPASLPIPTQEPGVKSEADPSSSEGLSDRLAKQTLDPQSGADCRGTPSPPPRAGKAQGVRKQTALQEKNRRAQRRFRERQKMKVAELEEQVATLTLQLDRVTGERAALASHASRLEAALAAATAREEAAAVAAPAGAAASSRFPGEETGPALPALSSSRPPGSGAGRGGAPGPAPAESGAGPTPRGAAGAGSSGVGRSAGEDDPALPVVFQGDLRLTLREGQSQSLTAEELRGMTPAELARYYKAYVNELAQSLVEGGAPAARVGALVDDVCRLWTRVGLCNPAGVKHFSLTRVEAGAGGAGPDDRVAAVSRALDLRADQRASLAGLRALFQGKLAGIRARRRGVVEALARAEPVGTGTRPLAALYLASHEAARGLREALREEHILVLDFESTVFKHVLSGLQVAQLMIHSFPWTPDCLALCTWVAAEAGDADALGALAAEAQRKAAAAAPHPGGGVGPAGPFASPFLADSGVNAGALAAQQHALAPLALAPRSASGLSLPSPPHSMPGPGSSGTQHNGLCGPGMPFLRRSHAQGSLFPLTGGCIGWAIGP
ncbi:hypothetical protein ACKKBG_A07735 [Auxenochlorella protothecoides x Auxenochlorella symbiontica]